MRKLTNEQLHFISYRRRKKNKLKANGREDAAKADVAPGQMHPEQRTNQKTEKQGYQKLVFKRNSWWHMPSVMALEGRCKGPW